MCKRRDYCWVSVPDSSYECLASQNFRDMPFHAINFHHGAKSLVVCTDQQRHPGCALESSVNLKESA